MLGFLVFGTLGAILAAELYAELYVMHKHETYKCKCGCNCNKGCNCGCNCNCKCKCEDVVEVVDSLDEE